MTSGIYCIENLVNGKKYIGRSVNITRRWNTHRSQLRLNCHPDKFLQNAWNKYGEVNFKFWIIDILPRDQEKLKLLEIYFIELYNSFWENGKGYNLTRGGENAFGTIWNEERRKEMSKRVSGKNHWNYGKNTPAETIEKMKNSQYGKTMSLEARKKLSITNSGTGNPNYGKVTPAETREKISNSLRRRNANKKQTC